MDGPRGPCRAAMREAVGGAESAQPRFGRRTVTQGPCSSAKDGGDAAQSSFGSGALCGITAARSGPLSSLQLLKRLRALSSAESEDDVEERWALEIMRDLCRLLRRGPSSGLSSQEILNALAERVRSDRQEIFRSCLSQVARKVESEGQSGRRVLWQLRPTFHQI
mmetsp:Transcript_83820/g.224177  ORF Transcript_83820/g.224177 Transcript_83820/m.224177 type:complete len:165 (-) Transcript_83820:984-1478(-)